MFEVAVSEIQKGVYIQTRKEALLFNVARFKSKSKSVSNLVKNLLFADDNALVAHTLNDIQVFVDRFATAAKQFSL